MKGGKAAFNQYNHKNERTMRAVDGHYRLYMYDESSHLIGEYTVNGTPIVEYVWLGDKPIAALYTLNNQIVYLLTDHQNKPRRGVDASTKQIVWAWDPDAFGVRQPHIEKVTVNLRFPGQQYDKLTGLYYNHNRYYDPKLGRYIEPDPIGLEGGLNPYAYAGNDPVNLVDPSGLLEIYAFPQPTGSGVEARYEFHFDPITDQSLDNIKKFLPKLIKRVNKVLDKVSNAMYPEPYTADDLSWTKNIEYTYDAGVFDATLEKEFSANYGKPNSTMNRLTRAEAENYLKQMYKSYPQDMKRFYDTPQKMLDISDTNARENWYNKTFYPKF